MIRGFARKLAKHLEELDIDGKILLYWVLKKQGNVGKSLTVNLLAFQNWLCLMELKGLFIKKQFKIILMLILVSSGGWRHIS
jgi:hypothetical protein